MLKLRTVSPYGLNLDVGTNMEQGDFVTGVLFPKLKVPVDNIGYRNGRHNRDYVPRYSFQHFIDSLQYEFDNNLINLPNLLRIFIPSLRKRKLSL